MSVDRGNVHVPLVSGSALALMVLLVMVLAGYQVGRDMALRDNARDAAAGTERHGHA